MKCKVCGAEAVVALSSHNCSFCGDCYLKFFRRQIEKGIKTYNLFTHSDKILVALSGGKDSLSLFLELHELGYDVSGLYIDLAIPDSSAIALHFVSNFCEKYNLPLLIVNLEKEKLAIPEVKKALKRPICSVCGQIKRHYFNKIALDNGFTVLATGHNLDDEAGRLFSNVLRWDESYLGSQGPLLEAKGLFVRKVKPLWRLTEFETANYAFLRNIEHHWHPCPYSGGASFSVLKGLMQRLEHAMPGRKFNFYQGFLEKGKRSFSKADSEMPLNRCSLCGAPSGQANICAICRIKNLITQSKE